MERLDGTTSENLNPDWFKNESLAALRNQLNNGHYPGYPHARLTLPEITSVPDGEHWRVILPPGPWETSAEVALPTQEETEKLWKLGLEFDQHGRPLHPWLDQMALDPSIGVLTGKGAYWQWGPNYTADPIITRSVLNEKEILLIQRGDTGHWALPGGFVDAGEDPFDSALREAFEETGLELRHSPPSGRLVYEGPLSDLRVTANAWPHTYAFHFDVTGVALDKPVGGDDARDARWVPLHQLDSVLFGSHAALIKMAVG